MEGYKHTGSIDCDLECPTGHLKGTTAIVTGGVWSRSEGLPLSRALSLVHDRPQPLTPRSNRCRGNWRGICSSVERGWVSR